MEQVEDKAGSNKVMIIVSACVVVGIMVAIAIPNLMDSGILPSEAANISGLRTISSAQELYHQRTGKFGNYFDLNDGKEKKYIDEVLAKADPDHLEHEDKSGHNFDISVNADNSDWWAMAYPGTWAMDGDRNFIIRSDGVIRYNKTEGDLTNFPYVLGED